MSKREAFLTLFGVGYMKTAPGTWGSAVALIAGIPILYFSASTLFLLAILVGVIAIKQIDIYEADSNSHDDSRIVIDELVGIWLTMSIAGFSVISFILSFVFFRIFDIWKPSIIGRVDKKVAGGLGVVGDDALAGFFAGIAALGVIMLLALIGFDTGIEVEGYYVAR